MQRCEGRDTEHADAGLWSAFSELGIRFGERAAILAPDRDTVTFAELASRIAAAKEQLNALGIGRGDRLAIALPNGPDMAVCFLSAMACAIAVPLNPSSTGNEFREYLRRVRPKALVVPAGVETPAQQVAREFGTSTIRLVPDVSKPSEKFTLAGSHAGCTDSRWNTNDDVGVILLTSGSTSRQKLVPVKPRHQIAYARGINEIFRLGPADRSLLVMPLFHASGLNSSFLIPLLNGAAVVCLREFDGDSFYKSMDAFKPTWITAGYAFLKAILDGVETHQEIVQRTTIRFIRSGTGRLQHAVKEGLEQAFRAPVLEQYSTTETGVIACSSMPPRQGKSGTAGRPIVNQVAIMGPDGAFLREARDGEIMVRGPSVFDGYLDDPEANQASFIDGWYRTGDLGRLDADGFLTITGRATEIINRGGEKISPHEIETVMAGHTAIRDIKVFGIPHPTLGEEVVAAVVLRSKSSANEAALKAFAGERLAKFKLPRRIFFRDSFPLGSSKKLDVRKLVQECEQELNAERYSATLMPERDLSPTEKKVRELWARVLGTDRVGVDENFFLLGGDSLKGLELLVLIETVFGIEVPAEAMTGRAGTVSGMAAEIERRSSSREHHKAGRPASTAATRAAFCIDDLLTLLTFLGLAPIAWLLPYKRWRSACNGLARAHVALKRLPAENLREPLVRLGAELACEEAQQRLLSAVYEDIVMTMREQLPIAWHPDIRLSGVEHITSALAAGHGAILWSCPTPFGGLISRKALKSIGINIIHLRSDTHPYSSSWFGMKILNRLRTHVEDRYVAGTVIASEGDTLSALDQLLRHLQANAVVAIAANGSEGKPFEMPFLGGTLRLSLGAPTLAALHGAPLLPLFTSTVAPGEFEIVIEPPVKFTARPLAGETARELASSYARILERYLQRHPAEWRGWFMRNTWSPGSSR